MSLIKCGECGKEISDKAETCPSCGNPMDDQALEVRGKVEIERTSKKWKKGSLVGALVLMGGFVAIMNQSFAVGFSLMFLAFCIIVVTNIGAWWTNG
jgi:uncharacterized membrane protein YvbJ